MIRRVHDAEDSPTRRDDVNGVRRVVIDGER